MRQIYDLLATTLEKHLNFDARYFLRGGFWLTVGQVIITLLGLLTTVAFAHILDENSYGVYRYIIGLAVIFSTFSLTGLGQAILQTAAKKWYGFYNETFKINIFYSLPIFILALSSAGYYWLNSNTTLAFGCLIIALLQPIINIFQFIPTFLHGTGRFKESTMVHTMKSIVSALISLGTLFLTNNILWLIVAYLGGQALTNIISNLWYRPHSTTPTPKEEFTRYINYAKHTSIRGLILNVAFRTDSIIVFTQLGAIELAIYTIANVIPEQIKNTFKSLSTLLLPKYASHDDFQMVRKSIPTRSFHFFLLLCGVSLAYVLISPFVYHLLFPKYEAAVFLSQLVALSFPALTSLIPMSAIESQIREKDLYFLNTSSAVIMLACTISGVLLYGLIGAVIGKILYRYIVLIITYDIYRKIY